MYSFSPETCLIKDTDGQIYNIIDLWKGVKVPVDVSKIQYNYAPRSCLVENIDGTTINIIDTILSVANGSNGGSTSNAEVIQARGEYRSLSERLNKDNEEVYATINAKDFVPQSGTNITIPHSKIGYTKDMVVKGATYQNLLKNDLPRPNDRITSYHAQRVISNDYSHMKIEPKNKAFIFWVNWGSVLDLLKPSTNYTVIFDINTNITINRLEIEIKDNGTSNSNSTRSTLVNSPIKGKVKVKLKTNSSFIVSDQKQALYINGSYIENDNSNNYITLSNPMILEGDYTNKSTPSFFEGIQSVGEKEMGKISILSTGKNLFDYTSISGRGITKINNGIRIDNLWAERIPYKCDLSPNKTYTSISTYKKIEDSVGAIDVSGGRLILFNSQTNTRITLFNSNGRMNTFTTPTDIKDYDYMIVYAAGGGGSYNGVVELTDLLIYEGERDDTSYEPFVKDTKDIILPPDCVLNGIATSYIEDTIEYTKGKIVYTKYIDKIVLDGSEDEVYVQTAKGTNVIKFTFDNFRVFTNYNERVTTISTGLPSITHVVQYNQDVPGVAAAGASNKDNGILAINYPIKDMETPDEAGLRKALAKNPLTIYYQLSKPEKHDIVELNTLNLETYLKTTHVSSTNFICPTLDFSSPVDVQATISMLREDNIQLSNELDTNTRILSEKDAQLQQEDNQLAVTDLDLDFRIFELESMAGTPITMFTSTKTRTIGMTPYDLMKKCIENGLYDKLDMEYKINRYASGNRITLEQQTELLKMIE